MYDDAAACYQRAISLEPQRAENYTALSRLWFFRDEKIKAVATLTRASDANPDDPAVHAAVSQTLIDFGMTDEALAAITRACDLVPTQVRYRLSVRSCWFRLDA